MGCRCSSEEGAPCALCGVPVAPVVCGACRRGPGLYRVEIWPALPGARCDNVTLVASFASLEEALAAAYEAVAGTDLATVIFWRFDERGQSVVLTKLYGYNGHDGPGGV